MLVDEKTVMWYRLHLFGRFIFGISHEIDNYLSVVVGFSELMKLRPENGENVRRSAEKIMGSAENLSRMMKKYTYYARPGKDEESIFEIGELIEELITFAGHDLKREGVLLRINVPAEDILLRGNRGDFAYMLLNIMVNASESMAQTGGCQSIEAHREDSDTILIRITDEGLGIPQELHEEVFKPGFTTKEENYRLGLGLPVSLFFAMKFGASITFSSEVGRGTNFQIMVPAKL